MFGAEDNDNFWLDCPLFAPVGAKVPVLPADRTAADLPDALGALSHLLYDKESPEEVAEELRDQGNRYFKRGCPEYYRLAISKYTEAIAVQDAAPEVTAAAFANRAAAQLKLENFGRALEDAVAAVALHADHVKARYRAAVAANALGKHKIAHAHCTAGLLALGASRRDCANDVSLLRAQQRVAEKQLEREVVVARRKALSDDKVRAARRGLETALLKRRVRMGLPLYSLQRSYKVTTPTFQDANSDVLLWPVMVLYPDAGTSGSGEKSDYLEQVCEDTTMDDIVATVLPTGAPPPSWDKYGMYALLADTVEVRYRTSWTKALEDADSDDEREFVGTSQGEGEMGDWKTISRQSSLAELLRRSDYVVPMFPVICLCLPNQSGKR
jgi:tetratricopeptide (TPR) repeat protein